MQISRIPIMANQFNLFTPTEKLTKWIAGQVIQKRLPVNGCCLAVFAAGLLSPLPLIIFPYSPSSPAVLFSPVLLFFYVAGESSLQKIEAIKGESCLLQRAIPFSPVISVFFWFQIVLCLVIYQSARFAFVRFLNFMAILSIIGAVVLIFGFLKLQNQPLRLHCFVRELDMFRKSHEQTTPFNYLTLAFKVFRPDLFTVIIFISAAINLYLLYVLVVAASLLFLGFTVYSLFLIRIMEEYPEKPADRFQSPL